MWFEDSNLEYCPTLCYAGELFSYGLISRLLPQEADAALADLDGIWRDHYREIAGTGLSWWRRALLPHTPPTAFSAQQTRENRLRALERATKSYTSAELLLYRLETIALDPARDFNLLAALKVTDPSAMRSLRAYERQLIRLTRAECRELLRNIGSIMTARHWSHKRFFKHYLGDVPMTGFDRQSFMSRLRFHAADDEPAPSAPARRSREVEPFFDNMDPQAAWIELCHKTGRLDLIAAWYSVPDIIPVTAISTLLYEALTLLPDEEVYGLIRASHLEIYARQIPGLLSLLRVEHIATKADVTKGIDDLTAYEAFVIHRYLELYDPQPGEIEEALGLSDRYDLPRRESEIDEILSHFCDRLAERVEEYAGRGSLKQAAAQAVTRADAWRALVNEVGGSPERFGSWTIENRRTLASELMRRHPEGLPEHLEMLAVKALLGPHLRNPELVRRAERRRDIELDLC